MTPRIIVRGLITYENKAFLVRLKKFPDFWCMPGGGWEQGEGLAETTKREIIEELGIVPKVGNLVYIQQFGGRGNYTPPEFIFHITNGQDFIHVDLGKTTHGKAEIEEFGFFDPRTVPFLPKFIADDWEELVKKDFSVPTTYMVEHKEREDSGTLFTF